MKTVVLCVLMALIATSFIFAQGRLSKREGFLISYNPKATPPPLLITDAYVLALEKTKQREKDEGSTNQYYCVAASCSSMTNLGATGWEFQFFSTNGRPINVIVYFDKDVIIGP
jgi:hypothetical protein